MTCIETTVSDGLWAVLCSNLNISETKSDLRKELGFAFGKYKSELANQSDPKTGEVRRVLLAVAEATDGMLSQLGPLMVDGHNGSVEHAATLLVGSMDGDSKSLDDFIAEAVLIRDNCRQLADRHISRGGPRPQDSRGVFAVKFIRLIERHGVIATDEVLATALAILLRAAGSRAVPAPESLAKYVRRIRKEESARVKGINLPRSAGS